MIAGGAAAAGVLGGLALGARRRSRKKVLGIPVSRNGHGLKPLTKELRSGAKWVAQAGRRAYELEADVRAVRAQAEQGRRQSPVEVLLSALTARKLPTR